MEIDTDEGFEDLEGLETPEAEVPEGPESVEESIAAAFEEVDAKHAEKAQEEPAKETAKEEKPESSLTKAARELAGAKRKAKGPKQVVEADELNVPARPGKRVAPEMPQADEKYDPPARYPVEMKEKFLKYPKELQAQVVKDWGEIEGQFTKLQQDYTRTTSRYAEVNQVIDHYLPRWNINNISPGQAIQQLCAAQDLINSDPVRGIALLMQKTGVTLEHLTGNETNPGQVETQQRQTFTQQPQNQGLTREELRQILAEERQSVEQSASLQADNAAADEIRNKIGPNGQYLYPELWDGNNAAGNYWNAAFCEMAKPLVVAFRKTQPGLSMAGAIEKAVKALRASGDSTNGSPSPQTQRLPNQQQEIQRARSASVSVRGRGNAAIPTSTKPDKGESVEDSLRAVWGANGSY